MYYKRNLAPDIKEVFSEKSCFLIGPRQTGKSSLILNELDYDHSLNLLDTDIYLRLSQRPARLRDEVEVEEN